MYCRGAAHPRAWDASEVAGAHAFDRAPRWLGHDDHGRETLSFIDRFHGGRSSLSGCVATDRPQAGPR
jgi:hypothetical protein